MRGESHYEVLKVPINATAEDINKSYRELAKVYHPDIKGKSFHPQMVSLNNAYRILKDPISRDDYNFTELLELRNMPQEVKESLPDKLAPRKGRPFMQTVMKKLTGKATIYTMTAVAIRFRTAMRYAISPKPYHQEKAIEELKKAIELEPKHVDSIYNIGVLYCRVGELANGLHYLKQYLALEENELVEALTNYIEEKMEGTAYKTKMLTPHSVLKKQ